MLSLPPVREPETRNHWMVRNSPNHDLGRLVSDRRKALGYTQEGVAKAITDRGTPVARETLASIERGGVDLPGREILKGISRVLEIPMAMLLIAAGYLEPVEARDFISADELRIQRDRARDLLRQLDEWLDDLESPESDSPGSRSNRRQSGG